MKAHFADLAEYDRWANESILTWMESHEELPEISHNFAHLLAEYQPWILLMKGKSVPTDFNPEPLWTVEQCRNNFSPMMDSISAFVGECKWQDWDRIVESVTPAGQSHHHSVRQILTNLFSHSEHHRGQILQMIFEQTGEYVPTLYMSWLRTRTYCA